MDPNLLTWSGLTFLYISFWMISVATMDEQGAVLILGSILMIGLAGVLDALDGDLARHQGTAGPMETSWIILSIVWSTLG